MGVAWTATAVDAFEALAPDDREIELVEEALESQSTSPSFGYRDILVPFQEFDQPCFITRVGRFAIIYQVRTHEVMRRVTRDLLVVAVQESLDAPLSILICDQDGATRSFLEEAIRRQQDKNDHVQSVSTLVEARHILKGANTIFVDPLTVGLDEATAFVLDVQQSFPEIAVVLYLDASIAERNRKEFFRGIRSMFFQYRTLDKKTPAEVFQEELRSVLKTCRRELTLKKSEASVKIALQTAEQSPSPEVMRESVHAIAELSQQAGIAAARPPQKTVFVSYRFADKKLVDGLVELLVRNNFTVTKGNSVTTYVSQGVLERIRNCDFFLCLMTRAEEKKDGTYTTSAWVLEEKGAALALGKKPVLMVQEGVTESGGLHGDWQLIRFTLEDFLTAALQAVDQLKSYSGDPSSPKP